MSYEFNQELPRASRYCSDAISASAQRGDCSWVNESFHDFSAEWLIISSGENIPYVPYDYQDDFVATLQLMRVVSCFKSRQMGLSEVICAYIIWRTLHAVKHGREYKTIIYSITQQDASDLLRRIKVMLFKVFEAGLLSDFAVDSKTEAVFDEGGNIRALPATRTRGGTVDLAVVDESDHVPDVDILLAGLRPTLSVRAGTLVQITTPNPLKGGPAQRALMKLTENDPSKIISQVSDPDSDKNYEILERGSQALLLLHWRAHPDRDDDWAQQEKDDLNYTDDEWAVEYELRALVNARMVVRLDEANQQFNGFSVRPFWGSTLGERSYDRLLVGIDPTGDGRDMYAASFVGQFYEGDRPILHELASYYERASEMDGLAHVKNICGILKQLYHDLPAITDGEAITLLIEKNGVGAGAPVMFELMRGEDDQRYSLPYGTVIEPIHWSEPSKLADYAAYQKISQRNHITFDPDSPIWGEYKNVNLDCDGKIAAKHPFKDDYSDAVAKVCGYAARAELPPKFLTDV